MLLPVANIKSQIKRIKTNEKARLRNKAAKSEIKTRIKTALEGAGTGDEASAEQLRVAVRKLDKAAAKGIIHRNQAANRKSALMHKIAAISAMQMEGYEGDQSPAGGGVAVAEAEDTSTTARGARRRGLAARARRPRRAAATPESEAEDAGAEPLSEAVEPEDVEPADETAEDETAEDEGEEEPS